MNSHSLSVFRSLSFALELDRKLIRKHTLGSAECAAVVECAPGSDRYSLHQREVEPDEAENKQDKKRKLPFH